MTKFELYVNGKDRLTLETFLRPDSEFSMSKIEGEKCYAIISEICKQKISRVLKSRNGQDLIIFYDDCILNVSEAHLTLDRRGTAPIRNSVSKFLQDKKRMELEQNNSKSNGPKQRPLKVTRKNKYGGKKIIITWLTLLLLISGMIAIDAINKADNNDIEKPIDIIMDIGEDQQLGKDDSCIPIFIDYENRSETEKARITKAYYGAIIEKYSNMYGVDPKIITAIATQERGVHSDKMDPGGATGLMQIQNSVWVGENLTAYNYEKCVNETVVVTKEDLGDVVKNIQYGCMIFQNCLGYMKGNTLAAIQCYNMGYGNMMKILQSYSLETGKSKNEILNDLSDYGWLEHRDIVKVGDKKYLEHVFSWIGPEISIDSTDELGKSIILNITNESEQKGISIS